MIDTSLGVLNGAIGDASASGSSAEWAMRSSSVVSTWIGNRSICWKSI